MYFVKTPRLLQLIFKSALWRIDDSDHIFLTFDDGPHPESTPRLLKLLADHSIYSTFFCSGHHIESYPDLYLSIKDAGHGIGGHGYKHLSGWKTKRVNYIKNTLKGQQLADSDLFRPPYGKISLKQYNELRSMLNIVMWDVMPGDFDAKVSAELLYNRILTHARKGSIIVLHDRPDTISKLEQLIPRLAEYYLNFGKINMPAIGN